MMRSALATVLITSALTSTTLATPQEAATSSPPVRQNGLTVGQPVDVQLRNARHVVGTVGLQLKNGFYVDQPPAAPSFVAYRDVSIVRDTSTGGIVQTPRSIPWLKPVVVAGVALLIARFVWGAFEQ